MSHSAHSYGGGTPSPKGSFKKGMGFVRSSMATSYSDRIFDLVKTLPKFSRVSLSPANSFAVDATIPLVNLDRLSETQGEARKRLVKAFGDALRLEGFVGIYAAQLNPVIHQTYEEMKRYFQRSFDQKILDWQANKGLQGFFHQGSECAPGSRFADLKESYYVPPGFKGWPKKPPSFARTITEYHTYMHEYAKSLFKVLHEYLGRPHAEVDQWFSNDANTLCLTRYLTLKPTDAPEALWTAPHKDPNALTLLTPGTIPGLQTLQADGQWKPIAVPPGYLIITTGLQVEHKTAGLIKARVRRVVNPGGRLTLAERYATTFYGTWKPDFSLDPFDSCLEIVTQGMSDKRKASFLKQFPAMSVKDREAIERLSR